MLDLRSAVSEPLLDLLASVPYLEEQPQEVLEALAAVAVSRRYPADSIVFLEGEPCAGLFVISHGVVKVSRFSSEGREHILHMLNPGDTFNDVATLDGGPNPATATAYSDVVLWHIDRRDLRRVAARYEGLGWSLVESAARRARYLMNVVEDLSMRSVRGRLAHLLLEQAEAYETDSMPRIFTQQEMASRLGTVREVVGRTLRSLAAERIIEFNRSRIVILDAARLEEEAATK